ncbi:MAG TPA: hypothetical protein VG714_10000 [Acidobacteriaceae bacterium]|nr:hypothetical protein [Acidobacteriaceae bacterium]
MRTRQAFAAALLAATPALTGCLTHTRTVPRTRPPEVVYSASLEQLLQQLDGRYKATRTATLFVEISASTGGSVEGQVKEYLNLSGYIIIQNPDHIRVLLKLPLGAGRALDMVSDGKNFKMIIPHPGCAIIGSDTSLPTQKGFYSLRPAVILDSLLIQPFGPTEDVSRTQDSRIIEAPKTKVDILTGKALGKALIEEPDYDIQFLSQPKGRIARTLRVVHIGRTDLLPYRQDIYNDEGRIETQAFYSNYQHFGDIVFPTKIVIQRPLDELGLTITVTKGTTFNQQLEPDQFDLGPIPASYPVQNMDDPVSAKSNPCVSHPAPPASAPAAK